MRLRRSLVALGLVSLIGGAVPAAQALNGKAARAAIGPVPAPLAKLDPGVGGFMSPNLSYVATLANDSPGVGARLMTVNGQKRLYVTGVQALTIYDVTKPELPMVLGRLELPNWENEDVTVSKDGKTVLISEFTGTYVHVIQVDELPGGLLAPKPVGFMPTNGGHIVTCIDDACNYVYGSEGSIIDLRDKTKPTVVKNWGTALGLGTSGHNVEMDGAGLAWTDTTPIAALNVTDPLNPKIIAKSNATEMGKSKTAYQHNNLRPFASQYQQRLTAEDVADPNLRPGEILLSNGETNFTGQCGSGSGPFATYSLKDFDKKGTNNRTTDFKPIEVLRPVSGTPMDGNAQVNALGCSGHWFTYGPQSTASRIKVAAAWYEHGTRLLDVDGTTGKIKQVGYFQPVVGSASAAHWINDEYIYVIDYARGIDIIKYNKNAPLPTQDEINESWLSKLGVKDPVSEQARFNCTLRQRQGAAVAAS